MPDKIFDNLSYPAGMSIITTEMSLYILKCLISDQLVVLQCEDRSLDMLR